MSGIEEGTLTYRHSQPRIKKLKQTPDVKEIEMHDNIHDVIVQWFWRLTPNFTGHADRGPDDHIVAKQRPSALVSTLRSSDLPSKPWLYSGQSQYIMPSLKANTLDEATWRGFAHGWDRDCKRFQLEPVMTCEWWSRELVNQAIKFFYKALVIRHAAVQQAIKYRTYSMDSVRTNSWISMQSKNG